MSLRVTSSGLACRRITPTDRGYAGAIVDRLEAILGKDLVGVYLHGSAVLGDFSRSRSDVDVLAVAGRTVSIEEKETISRQLGSSSLPCPAGGLEFHLISRETLGTPSMRPVFELHVSTTRAVSGEPDTVVDGHGHAGDPDLVMHFAVLHQRGVAIKGPDPSELFAPIPREGLRRAFAYELGWAEQHASSAYQVLNACRAWRFLEENVICSKTEGAEWARPRVADPSVIDQALEHRRGSTDAYPDSKTSKALLDDVRARLDE